MLRYNVLSKSKTEFGSSWYFIQAFRNLDGRHTWTISFNQDGSRAIEVALDDKAYTSFRDVFPYDLEPKLYCPHCTGLIS